ncbi:MAG: ATP synthase subunit C family protein [Alphaproteobacteria bacterium]|jgi:F0F1-type ATP synthase membrane subunit c/vacuolar-type H+-ATPase subunit K|nr:ATP synthase subunit C family protein [Alphaproteobacteria bacterium]MDP5012495.1 ATP synthase subunit C family protein [Alphaproteobacteria bacterium]
MELAGITKIAAAIAILPLFGVGLALGNLFSTLISSIARNPSVKDELFSKGILAFALTESIALFALIVSLLILFG